MIAFLLIIKEHNLYNLYHIKLKGICTESKYNFTSSPQHYDNCENTRLPVLQYRCSFDIIETLTVIFLGGL